jgi:hypothetical protein
MSEARIDPRAGQLPETADLVDVERLLAAYYEQRPDPSDPFQHVGFGTSGHRGERDAGAREHRRERQAGDPAPDDQDAPTAHRFTDRRARRRTSRSPPGTLPPRGGSRAAPG